MQLIPITEADEIIEELKKQSLNEAGSLPVINVTDEINFTANFTTFIVDDHLKSKHHIKKFAESFENPGLILFDAHLDSLNSEDLIPFLANIISKKNIIIVGAREWNKDEYFFIKNNNIKVYTMKEITMEGKTDVCDAVMTASKDFDALFVSIDADVLDQNTGGLTARELIYFLQRLKKLKNFKAADLAEFKNTKLAAKIIKELA